MRSRLALRVLPIIAVALPIAGRHAAAQDSEPRSARLALGWGVSYTRPLRLGGSLVLTRGRWRDVDSYSGTIVGADIGQAGALVPIDGAARRPPLITLGLGVSLREN